MLIKTKTTTLALTLSSLLSGAVYAHSNQVFSAQESVKMVSAPQTASQKANVLFDEFFMQSVMANPINQTYLGIKQDYDKWNDISDAGLDADLALTKTQLAKLLTIDVSQLDEQTTLSYELLKASFEQRIADDKWRYHTYPINQMYGLHSMVPSFLIN